MWVVWDGVVVYSDVDVVQEVFCLFVVDFGVVEVDQYEVYVGVVGVYGDVGVFYVLL